MRNFPKDQVRTFQCACDHPAHQMIWRLHPGDMTGERKTWWEPELTVTFYLDPALVWYKRLWYGLKYIFGFSTYYDATPFADAMVEVKDAREMADLLAHYCTLHDVYTFERNKKAG